MQPNLDTLRADIEAIERRLPEGGLKSSVRVRPIASDGLARAMSFGLEALDSRFSLGGLSFGAHQIAGQPGDCACAIMFAALITARRFKADPDAQALVVQERAVLAESGGLYGPGLAALGIDPGRLVFVVAHDGTEALRMVDEAVRSGAVSVVLAELGRGARLLDLPATQRFNLYGQQTSTLTLLATPDLAGASAAMTRWRATTAPSTAPRRYLGPPSLTLDLTRNRLGPVGRFTVDWSSDDETFRIPIPIVTAAALRPPVVRPPVHRQDPARAA
jgi:protein ImuA